MIKLLFALGAIGGMLMRRGFAPRIAGARLQQGFALLLAGAVDGLGITRMKRFAQ